jgi:hypothetical protein
MSEDTKMRTADKNGATLTCGAFSEVISVRSKI